MNVRVIGPAEVRDKLQLTKHGMADRGPRPSALLGGGVIGGGWAARFVLNGVDVGCTIPTRRRRMVE